MEQNKTERYKVKKAITPEAFVFLIVLVGGFGLLGARMGVANMFNTLMNTAYSLLMETVFYIMALAVVMGAVSSLLSEFGVIALINKLLSPLMRPLYDLPGAASMGVIATFLSDNPAILTLANDMNFRRYFKQYQLPALTNIGTSFGMGLIVVTFMLGMTSPTGESFGLAVGVGLLSAVIGSIVSTRIMLLFTSRVYGRTAMCDIPEDHDHIPLTDKQRLVRTGNIGLRAIDAMLQGGKSGVTMGLDIIPGVLVICTLVMMLTNGASADGTYTGAAYEGISLLPTLASKIDFLLTPLFGFTSPEGLSIPITALGAAGAAIGFVPQLIANGLANAHDVAVFTSMCMCWSGYLSTHVAMMDSLKCNNLTGKAIIAHTIGGLVAGIAANWIYQGASLIF